MDEKKIFVTQPTLPPLNEFIEYLNKIWETKTLTNCGPFHNELESRLCEYLGVEHISLFSNGTIALVTALQALRVTGEVITTPYSFVATSHSLLWNGLKPVFVDIDANTLNIDPEKIEAAITPQTTAILPVHCYGRPCDVEKIQRIAEIYNLKIIYDAAHAFGVRTKCGSLLNYGDLSVLSFHATKVFNTFEGGAIVSPDAKTKKRIDYLKNFGFADEVTVVAPGINGKMSEINAAFGILQLNHLNKALDKRRKLNEYYISKLSCVQGIECVNQFDKHTYESNNSYFPIVINDAYPLTRDQLYEKLKLNNIFSRRYFYPLITDFPMYRGVPSANPLNIPVAKDISNKILCLPIYSELGDTDQQKIINIISEV